MKTGWWQVNFDITLDGEKVAFEDLSEDSQRHIMDLLAQRCVVRVISEKEK